MENTSSLVQVVLPGIVYNKALFDIFGGTGALVERAASVESDGSARVQGVGFDGSDHQRIRVETNGTLITSVYGKASSTLTALGVEATTGELRTVLIGHDGSALTRVKTETTGEIDIILHGKDAAGPNIDAILTNDGRAIFVEIWNHYVARAPQVFASSEADLWDPGVAGLVYAVEFRLLNTDSSARTVTIGVEAGSTGGLQVAGTWLDAESLDVGATYPADEVAWAGPFIIAGDDAIRGFASTADVVNIQWRIKQVNRV